MPASLVFGKKSEEKFDSACLETRFREPTDRGSGGWQVSSIDKGKVQRAAAWSSRPISRRSRAHERAAILPWLEHEADIAATSQLFIIVAQTSTASLWDRVFPNQAGRIPHSSSFHVNRELATWLLARSTKRRRLTSRETSLFVAEESYFLYANIVVTYLRRHVASYTSDYSIFSWIFSEGYGRLLNSGFFCKFIFLRI